MLLYYVISNYSWGRNWLATCLNNTNNTNTNTNTNTGTDTTTTTTTTATTTTTTNTSINTTTNTNTNTVSRRALHGAPEPRGALRTSLYHIMLCYVIRYCIILYYAISY